MPRAGHRRTSRDCERDAVLHFDRITEKYGDAVVAERLLAWYRREFRGPAPTRVYGPATRGTPIVNFRRKFEEALLGSAFPDYDVLYRDFRVLEESQDGTRSDQ